MKKGFRVSDDSTTQCLLLPEIFGKQIVLQFDQRNGSSDVGAILLKAADRRYGLIQALVGCLRDKRQAGKVDHSLRESLSQRVVFWLMEQIAQSKPAKRGTGKPH